MNDEALTQTADDVYESVRTLNHATIFAGSLPAPLVYALLGNLNGAAYGLGQLAGQLAVGLERSLTTHDVYDRAPDGITRDPAAQVQIARQQLDVAAVAAEALGQALSAAQVAINGQGYNLPAAADDADADDADDAT